MNRNLLIVDDEMEILEWLAEIFTQEFDRKISVYTAPSAREALRLLEEVRFDVVLTDIKMPGMDGITLFERIKENWPRCKTVFLTGYRNFDDLYRVIQHRDVKYLLKTEGDAEILSAVRASFDELDNELEEMLFQAEKLERLKVDSSLLPPGQISALSRLLETRKKEDYFLRLEECLQAMRTRTSRHDPQALEVYYAIAVRLLQFVNEHRLNEQMAFHVALYKLTSAEDFSGWGEAAQYLIEVSQAIFTLMEDAESGLSKRQLKRVVDYIDGHLGEDLTLGRLSQIGGFNASYLSRLFKQVTGQGPSEYILHQRMELAKQLLTETNEMIQTIAEKTGYLSAHSFTRAFRTEVGIAPTEYRIMTQDSQNLSKK